MNSVEFLWQVLLCVNPKVAAIGALSIIALLRIEVTYIVKICYAENGVQGSMAYRHSWWRSAWYVYRGAVLDKVGTGWNILDVKRLK